MTATDLIRAAVDRARGVHVLVWLAIALAPAFSVTAFVTAAHREHQRTLAHEWEARGQAALESGQPAAAVSAFRNALRFAREDRDLRLRLGESLAAAGRITEARAYLLGLWQDQPGSGRVNLQLARLAAHEGSVPEASRYYHDAIEGAWSDSAEERRRAVRLELGEYLVSQGAGDLAEVELIALAADLPPDRASQAQIANLLARAGLHRRALALFDQMLESGPADVAALTGAAEASLALGNHAGVVRYLRRIPNRRIAPDAAEMLEVSILVLELDPYARGLRARDRAVRARRALAAADARLRGCLAQAPDLEPLQQETAAALKTHSRNALTRDPDALDAVLALTVRGVQTAEGRCGPPAPIDRALLLLAAPRAESRTP